MSGQLYHKYDWGRRSRNYINIYGLRGHSLPVTTDYNYISYHIISIDWVLTYITGQGEWGDGEVHVRRGGLGVVVREQRRVGGEGGGIIYILIIKSHLV